MISVTRLKELLSYDSDSGLFTWRVSQGSAQRGTVAGLVKSHQYVSISIEGSEYYAHRLAWLYMTGFEPTDQIDHINRCCWDNRWINLRSATSSENMRNTGLQSNNTSGVKGVSKRRNKWRARITVEGKTLALGTYEEFDDAVKAREEAERKYF